VERAHYGLKGLRERAEIFGGRLEVGSQLKHGTTVKLVLPAVEVEI
jgi:signal transduction histidine kinase